MVTHGRRGRLRATLAVGLSLVLGSGQILPATALAQEGAPVEAVAGEPVLVAAANVPEKKVGDVTIGANNSAKKNPNNPLVLLRNAGFDFAQQAFPIFMWTEPDGTEVFTVGIDHKNTALWKDIINGKATMWDNALRNFNKVGTKGNKFIFKPAFQVSAIHKSKDQRQWGEAAILAGMTGGIQGQFYFITAEFNFTGLIGARAPFRYDAKDGGKFQGMVNLKGNFTPKFGVGPGLAYIGRFGVYGTGTLDTEGTVIPISDAGWNYLRLTGSFGVEVIGLVFRVWHRDIWSTKTPIDIITPRAITPMSEQPMVAGPMPETEADYVCVPLVAQAASGEWHGTDHVYVDAPYLPDRPRPEGEGSDEYESTSMTNEQSTPQMGLRLLKKDVYPDAQVNLVSVPGGAVMCWIEQAASDANHMNATRLMWSRYDEGTDTWSAPGYVCAQDGTADFEPDLFAEPDGTVHAVWLNASKEVPRSADSIDDVASLLDVSYARLAPGATSFGEAEVVSAATPADTYLRTHPEVSAAGGDVVVGWSTIAADHLFDLGGDHRVVMVRGASDGAGRHTWSESSTKYTSAFEVTALDAGVLGTEPTLAWTADDLMLQEDGTVTSGAHVPTLSLTTYGGTHKDIENARNIDFVQNGASGALTWSASGTDGAIDLHSLTSAGASPSLLLSDCGLAPNYQIDGDLATKALITYQSWEASPTEGEEGTTDVYGRVLTAGTTLSDEALLVAHAEDLTSHDVAYVGSSPLVAVAAEKGVGGSVSANGSIVAQAEETRSADLLVARGDSLERLETIDFLYDETMVVPGATVPTYVRVSNEGLTPVTGGVSAQVVDDATGAVLGTGTFAGTIPVGETADIPVLVKVPAISAATGYAEVSAKANFMGALAVDSYALNLDTLLVAASTSGGGQVTPDPVNPSPWPAPEPTGNGGYHRGDWYYDGSGSTTSNPVTTDGSRSTGNVVRRSGATRYDTMRDVVGSSFDSADWAVVASGQGFADALSALSLAGAHDAPVVLTASDALSPQAASTLEALGVKHVVVVGGPAAVSDAVVDELRARVGDVTRIAGEDRVETSLEVMRATRASSQAADTVFVATGTGFADALSAGPLSWRLKAPVVLAAADGTLSEAALAAIRGDAGIRRVVLLGGAAVVSDAVRAQLGDGYEYVRLGGASRYETSVLVARWAASAGLGWSHPYLATGQGFADALAGGACAGKASSCLLLVDDSQTAAIDAVRDNAAAVRGVTILGGTAAVPATVENRVREAIS